MPKFKLFIIIGSIIFGSGLAASSALASGSSSLPAPYSQGAQVVKVLYPADGSTVTITATGAVIKQSPGHSAYREGWINPDNICSINVAADLNGQLRAGSTNPYTSEQRSASCTSSKTSSPAPAKPTSQPQTNASANATATAAVSYAPATVQTAGESTTPTQTQTSASAAKTLPNTGPGPMLPIAGVSTIVGTVGHFLYSRRRFS